jgi:starch synthase
MSTKKSKKAGDKKTASSGEPPAATPPSSGAAPDGPTAPPFTSAPPPESRPAPEKVQTPSPASDGENGGDAPASPSPNLEPVSASAVSVDPFDVARPDDIFESVPGGPFDAGSEGSRAEPAAATPEPSPAAANPEAIPEPQVSIPRFGPMYIVQITPELAPVAKVGGMADVVSGLGRELALRGNSVEIILPKYNNMRYDHIWGLHGCYDDLWVPWFGGHIHCSVLSGSVHGRNCFFIDAHSDDNFFNRGVYYGCHDDIMRFAFFSRAALEFLYKTGKHPEIIHCHDWPTGLVPVMLYEIYQWLGMSHSRVCYTIHNFRHQGTAGANLLYATGLNRPEHFFQQSQLGDDFNRNAVNMMKGGIVYSNFVTTVSPHHAWEAKDQGQGFGLESTLHTFHTKYGGIVNGVDYDYWNPEIDHYIPHHFGVDSVEGKYQNKAALRHRLLLADGPMPIIAFVGRLDPQKGLDLVRHGLFFALGNSAQFVLLGSSPDAGINSEFWGLKQHLNNNPDCHLEVGFNEELAHLIYAGADMIIVPSRYEPCGLTQLIALRYGTVPIVRSVGGLADTVFDKDYCDRPLHERNGYVFADATPDGLAWAMDRAISCYYGYPQDFRALMLNGMRTDYSWNHPAQHYLNVYEHIRNK